LNEIDPLGLDCCKQKYSDCLAKCIEKERFNMGAVLGTAASTLGLGTMPKTPAELRSLGQSAEEINPYTSQPSRWAGRTGIRGLRNFGRTIGGKALGGLTTGALVFEGFYDIGAIGRCSVKGSNHSITLYVYIFLTIRHMHRGFRPALFSTSP
jgi:hypothetical protein